MDKIVKYINTQTNNKYQNLLFFGAVLSQNTSTMQIKFDIDDKSLKSQENVEELKELCKKYLCSYINKIEIIFKNCSLTMEEFKDVCKIVLNNYFSLSNTELSNIVFNFNDEITKIIVPIKFSILNNPEVNDIIKDIKNEISSKTNQNVEIEFEESSTTSLNLLDDRKSQILEDTMIDEVMNKNKKVELSNIERVFGDFDSSNAYLAGSLIDEPENEIISVVGVLKSVDIRETKPKEAEEGKRQLSPRKYLSFELEYDGETTKCILFFTKDMAEPIMPNLDSIVVVQGKFNNFNGNSSIRVSSIAKCTFVPPQKVYRSAPSNYRYVKPEPYEFTEQINFFLQDEVTKKDYLLNNTFIVYDLETTGIKPELNYIIDIGAFKIVKGKIVEKFSTFVNPECEIPEEASKVNRITNKLVENSPTIDMVLPDFYKFCEGSIIVGYNNINFDDLFIAKESKRLSYNFDNKRDDVFNIAKKNILGLKNYKLSTVCQAENVPLIDAHRAINDALATAKLFIKLVEKYY